MINEIRTALSCLPYFSAMFVMAMCVSLGSTHAQTNAPVAATPVATEAATSPADLQRAESYLQTLKTVKARFAQTNPDGSVSKGTFYLSRPGRLRFEYDAPITDFVVADGFLIHFYDGVAKQASNAPIGQTLADFLLRKKITLSGDVKATRVRRGGGLLQITLVQVNDPGAGSLTLGFTEGPEYQLKKWRVVDATGAITEIDLSEFQPNVTLAPSLFVYNSPGGDRLNR